MSSQVHGLVKCYESLETVLKNETLVKEFLDAVAIRTGMRCVFTVGDRITDFTPRPLASRIEFLLFV